MYFADKLIFWYNENRRNLPWRNTRDPYRIWLSEIILQQTRIAQGEPYYKRFVEKYPDVASLAEASEEEVLKMWQGLGYYSRARNMRAAAVHIHRAYHDEFPQDYAAVRALPGVGDYTAAAIVSFAFNLPYPVVDGNVIRFIARLAGIFDESGSPACKKRIMAFLQKEMDEKRAGLFNQALMEFGALACTPGRCLCMGETGPTACPFSKRCYAFQNGVVDRLPVKRPKAELPLVGLHYLLLREGNGFWVHRRGYNDLWRGMYDLPSLTAAEAEACENAPDIHFLKVYRQTLTHRRLSVYFYRVDPEGATAKRIRNAKEYQKTTRNRLSQLAVPKVIEKFLQDFNIF